MPVEYFLRYQGKCYDVGTKLRFRSFPGDRSEGMVGVIEKFVGSTVFIRGSDGCLYGVSTNPHLKHQLSPIVEIINPVYYKAPSVVYGCERAYPSEESVFIGWVWYIAIMLIGMIFKDRFMIWTFTSAVFFLWKNGFLNGGKK